MTHLKSCTRISGFIEITIQRKLPIEIHCAYIATIYHWKHFYWEWLGWRIYPVSSSITIFRLKFDLITRRLQLFWWQSFTGRHIFRFNNICCCIILFVLFKRWAIAMRNFVNELLQSHGWTILLDRRSAILAKFFWQSCGLAVVLLWNHLCL